MTSAPSSANTSPAVGPMTVWLNSRTFMPESGATVIRAAPTPTLPRSRGRELPTSFETLPRKRGREGPAAPRREGGGSSPCWCLASGRGPAAEGVETAGMDQFTRQLGPDELLSQTADLDQRV